MTLPPVEGHDPKMRVTSAHKRLHHAHHASKGHVSAHVDAHYSATLTAQQALATEAAAAQSETKDR